MKVKADNRRSVKLNANKTASVLRMQRTNELTRALSVDELVNILLVDALKARKDGWTAK